jgi:hypothetical protein
MKRTAVRLTRVSTSCFKSSTQDVERTIKSALDEYGY